MDVLAAVLVRGVLPDPPYRPLHLLGREQPLARARIAWAEGGVEDEVRRPGRRGQQDLWLLAEAQAVLQVRPGVSALAVLDLLPRRELVAPGDRVLRSAEDVRL